MIKIIILQVHGFVKDVTGSRVATVFGKWDESIYFVKGDGTNKPKDSTSCSDASLLWERIKPIPNLTRYNLTSFSITLNELAPGLKVNVIYTCLFFVHSHYPLITSLR